MKTENINAEWAVKEVTENFVMIFESMDIEYMKEIVNKVLMLPTAKKVEQFIDENARIQF